MRRPADQPGAIVVTEPGLLRYGEAPAPAVTADRPADGRGHRSRHDRDRRPDEHLQECERGDDDRDPGGDAAPDATPRRLAAAASGRPSQGPPAGRSQASVEPGIASNARRNARAARGATSTARWTVFSMAVLLQLATVMVSCEPFGPCLETTRTLALAYIGRGMRVLGVTVPPFAFRAPETLAPMA
jgi:hypothetical protein